jgi:hypothetical protein
MRSHGQVGGLVPIGPRLDVPPIFGRRADDTMPTIWPPPNRWRDIGSTSYTETPPATAGF